MRVDLHTHSTASDGQYSPRTLVELAKSRGLELLALTDHDTLDGLEEAVETGRILGLPVLRGVELSAREYRNLHILGYGFRPGAPELEALCTAMKEGRNQRKHRLIGFLREKGVELTLEEVEEIAGGSVIARPHFAQALVRRGYAASVQEAFERYLDTPEYARIKRVKPDVRTCIETIHAAGGVAALAHPYQVRLGERPLESLVEELAGCGLDAIECYYPRHTPEQTASYLQLAERFGLGITGGSDFHGEAVKPDISLAAWNLDISWMEGTKKNTG